MIIGGGIFFFDKGHTASQRIIEYTEVVSSNSRLYILPDSSKVWMQAGSRLRFSQDFMSNREVWLEGVSTFEVTKRKGHNFKVYIDQAFVEVKGTVDMRMDDLIEAIHDIYHIPVELDRKVARNDLFTGYMRYDDPASKVIEKICINMNLKFKKETQKIIIYK